MGGASLVILVLVSQAVAQSTAPCLCNNGTTTLVSSSRQFTPSVTSATNDTDSPSDSNACFSICDYTVIYNGNDSSLVWHALLTGCKNLFGGFVIIKNGNGQEIKRLTECADLFSGFFLQSTNLSIHMEKLPSTGPPMQVKLYLELQEGKAPATGPTQSTTTTTPTTTTTTTATPVGPVRNSTKYLQLDIAFAIDGRKDDRFVDMQAFATQLVKSLIVYADPDNKNYARVSLLWLIGNTGSAPPVWSFDDKSLFAGAVDGFTPFPDFMNESLYGQPLMDFITNAFNVSHADVYSDPPRRNAERVLILLTAKDASDRTLTDLSGAIVDSDIHTILVNFGTSNLTNIKAMLGKSSYVNEYSYVNESSSEKGTELLDDLIANGDKLCSQPNVTRNDTTGVFTMTSPNYVPIKLGEPVTGQKKRYCNYQNKSFELTGGDATQNYIKMHAEYELESERDKLLIINDKGKEEAVWTGLDVDHAEICFKTTNATVHFTTDEKEVFRGFLVTAKFVANCSDPIA